MVDFPPTPEIPLAPAHEGDGEGAPLDLGTSARTWATRCLALLITLTTCAGPATAQEPDVAPPVTEEQRAWLASHETIRVAFDGYFPPYSFRNEAGELEGLAVDIFALLSERLGVEFEVVPTQTWNELYDGAVARDIDVVATMVQRPDRDEHFVFTRPYIFKSLVIVTRADDDRIRQRENLAGRTLALVESYQYVRRIVEEFPTATPQYHDHMVDALNAVSVGQADAAITFLGGGHYLISRHMMTNLRFVAVYEDTSDEAIGVRSDWPELAVILDQGVQSITAAERLELERRWLPADAAPTPPTRLELTESERRWIAEHPVIRVGVDPEFRPFEFIDDAGEYRGIAADHLALLGPRLGLNLEVVPNLTWSEAVERARRGEIDLLPIVDRTREREGFLTFSEPYVEFQRVIVTRTDMPFLRGLADLRELRVAVQENSSHAGFLNEQSDIEAMAYPTLEATILAVSSGEADALVGNVASLTYWIRRLNLSNLKVAGAASHARHSLHMATRSDWPELAGIIQKGLASVTPEESEEITERWVVLHYERGVDRQLVMRTLGAVTLVIVLLALWLLWLKRQKLQVEQARDAAVASEKDAQQANDELNKLREELEDLVTVRTAELMQVERRFYEAQKMEALGTLVGGIAHDFNNILTGMLASIFVVQLKTKSAPLVKRLHSATELGHRGADLIRQLLAVARKSGRRKSHVDLGNMLEGLAPLIRTSVPATIEIEFEGAPPGLAAMGNTALLQQVVLNLVNNARDAVLDRDGACIRVAIHELGPDEARPDELDAERIALIEVEDNGEGMSAEVASHIFEPFFTTKPAERGSGLGLAMVHGAVKDHGGHITVRSDAGEGSTFRVYLPLSDAPEEHSAITDDAVIRGAGETLLLVDDEPAVLENHAAMLQEFGYVVHTATNGEEALELLDDLADDVALVILDVLMPKLDGVATRREIRRRWPQMRLLFLSAFDPFEELPDRLQPTSEVLLHKPCSAAELSATIAALLSSEPASTLVSTLVSTATSTKTSGS